MLQNRNQAYRYSIQKKKKRKCGQVRRQHCFIHYQSSFALESTFLVDLASEVRTDHIPKCNEISLPELSTQLHSIKLVGQVICCLKRLLYLACILLAWESECPGCCSPFPHCIVSAHQIQHHCFHPESKQEYDLSGGLQSLIIYT